MSAADDARTLACVAARAADDKKADQTLVLAVGDAQFQKKCLGKMEAVAAHQGRTVLFVSHKLEEVYELCDTVTVLRDGKVVLAGASLAGVTQPEIVNLMVGRQFAAREEELRFFESAAFPELLARHGLDLGGLRR